MNFKLTSEQMADINKLIQRTDTEISNVLAAEEEKRAKILKSSQDRLSEIHRSIEISQNKKANNDVSDMLAQLQKSIEEKDILLLENIFKESEE